MRRYRFAGVTLAADFPLPPLPRSASRPSLTVTLGERLIGVPTRPWSRRWTQPNGRLWMQIARKPGGYFVQFPSYAEFEIGSRSVICHPRAGVPARTLRHLLLDQVLPARLAGAGRLVLHASAVAQDGAAAGFVGGAGVGKSTLAAALVARGAAVVTDDALVLERHGRGLRAIATYPGLRLWPDAGRLLRDVPRVGSRVSHYSPKVRWSGRDVPFAAAPSRVRILFLIARGRESRVRAIAPREALLGLIRGSMLLDTEDVRAVRRAFDLAAFVAGRIPIVRLEIGPGRRALSQACDLVQARLSANESARGHDKP